MSRPPAPPVEVEPSFDSFAATYGLGRAQVVWTRLVADLETPVSAMLKLSDNRPMSFLLESVEGGEVRGRYSIIGLEPDIIWRAFGNRAEINRTPRGTPDTFTPETAPNARLAAGAAGGVPHRDSAGSAADGGRRVRLFRLRQHPPDRAPAEYAAGPARRSRRDPGAPDRHGDLRCGQGRDDARHAGLSAVGR